MSIDRVIYSLAAMATEIIFHVHSDIERAKAYIQCSGQENQTLKEAIWMQKNRVLSYPVNEYIFKANVKGHTEQVGEDKVTVKVTLRKIRSI
jgi:hypothetical protein